MSTSVNLNSCKPCVSLRRWKCKKESSNNLFSRTNSTLRLNRKMKKTKGSNRNWRRLNLGMNQHRKHRKILGIYVLSSKSIWNRRCDLAIRALKMWHRRIEIWRINNRLIMKRSERKWWVWRRIIISSKATVRCSSSSWSWRMCSWPILRPNMGHKPLRCSKKSTSRLLRRAWRASRRSWTKVEGPV